MRADEETPDPQAVAEAPAPDQHGMQAAVSEWLDSIKTPGVVRENLRLERNKKSFCELKEGTGERLYFILNLLSARQSNPAEFAFLIHWQMQQDPRNQQSILYYLASETFLGHLPGRNEVEKKQLQQGICALFKNAFFQYMNSTKEAPGLPRAAVQLNFHSLNDEMKAQFLCAFLTAGPEKQEQIMQFQYQRQSLEVMAQNLLAMQGFYREELAPLEKQCLSDREAAGHLTTLNSWVYSQLQEGGQNSLFRLEIFSATVMYLESKDEPLRQEAIAKELPKLLPHCAQNFLGIPQETGKFPKVFYRVLMLATPEQRASIIDQQSPESLNHLQVLLTQHQERFEGAKYAVQETYQALRQKIEELKAPGATGADEAFTFAMKRPNLGAQSSEAPVRPSSSDGQHADEALSQIAKQGFSEYARNMIEFKEISQQAKKEESIDELQAKMRSLYQLHSKMESFEKSDSRDQFSDRESRLIPQIVQKRANALKDLEKRLMDLSQLASAASDESAQRQGPQQQVTNDSHEPSAPPPSEVYEPVPREEPEAQAMRHPIRGEPSNGPSAPHHEQVLLEMPRPEQQAAQPAIIDDYKKRFTEYKTMRQGFGDYTIPGPLPCVSRISINGNFSIFSSGFSKGEKIEAVNAAIEELGKDLRDINLQLLEQRGHRALFQGELGVLTREAIGEIAAVQGLQQPAGPSP